MTIPDERTWSVLRAGLFLTQLVNGEVKRVPAEVRESAKSILRHYPTRFDLSQTADELPDLWGKP